MSDKQNNSDEIKGEISLRAGEEERAHLPEIPSTVLKALHREIAGSKDSIEEDQCKSSICTIDDIKQLYLLLDQWSSQYQVRSRQSRFIVSHMGHDQNAPRSKYNFSSIESLIRYDYTNAAPANSIELYYEFIILNPNTAEYEGYGVVVVLNGYLLFKDHENAFRGIPQDSVDVRVEYVDYLIAKNIISIVRDWYNAL